jgi:hypothetical protein
MMPTDISRTRDGESRRSDQTSTRRDASSKPGRIRDFAIHQYQISEQQRDGKGPAPAEREDHRAIGEDGKPVAKQIRLSNRYDKDHPGLKGGMYSGDGSSYDGNYAEYMAYQLEQAQQERINILLQHQPPEASSLQPPEAINIQQPPEASSHHDQPEASSSRQGDISPERKNDIKELIENLIAIPGIGHQKEKIRQKMRANKIDVSEYRYVQRSVYDREDLDNTHKRTLMANIRISYCK